MEKNVASYSSLRKVTSESPRTTEALTLTSILAYINSALLLNRIGPEIEKILRKNQNNFRRN